MRYITFLLLALALFTACKSKKTVATPEPVVETAPLPPPPPIVDSVFFTYKRTPCFGMCPVFEMTVYKSGRVVYEGKNFTNRIGLYETTWSSNTLTHISAVADSIGYAGFDAKYDNPHVTDLPTTTTSLLIKGQLKTVANRHKGPGGLQRLYRFVDESIESSQWQPAGK